MTLGKFELYLAGIIVFLLIGMGFYYLVPHTETVDGKKVETYFAHITESYEEVDEGIFLTEGYVAPKASAILPRKVVTDPQGKYRRSQPLCNEIY